jgi:phosphoribosyl-ATP pyrophosphohydrolase
MAKSAKKKTTARPGASRTKLSQKPPGKSSRKTSGKSEKSRGAAAIAPVYGSDVAVLDRLFAVVEQRRDADPAVSHSARLLSRGPAKVAQKFGEEAVECLIEAVAGNREALVAESADVLYHLLVLWVSSGVSPPDVWAELVRREGISGVAEKAARTQTIAVRGGLETSKIP